MVDITKKLTKDELIKWERDWNFHKWKEDLFKREVIYVTSEKAASAISSALNKKFKPKAKTIWSERPHP